MNRKLQKIDYLLGGVFLGVFFTTLGFFYISPLPVPADPSLPSSHHLEVCFTPPQGCTHKIIQRIDQTATSIFIQAYSFTSPEIEQALLRAHKRGVKIQVIVDRGQKKAKGSIIHSLAQAGISLYFDLVSGLAHNKVMILDQETVITGSFNFTQAANTRNAENLLIIKDKELAILYKKNWEKRLAQAIPYKEAMLNEEQNQD